MKLDEDQRREIKNVLEVIVVGELQGIREEYLKGMGLT